MIDRTFRRRFQPIQLECLEARRLLAADWMGALPNESIGQPIPSIIAATFSNHIEIESVADIRLPVGEQRSPLNGLSTLTETHASPEVVSGVATQTPVADTLFPNFVAEAVTVYATNTSTVELTDSSSVFSSSLSSRQRD